MQRAKFEPHCVIEFHNPHNFLIPPEANLKHTKRADSLLSVIKIIKNFVTYFILRETTVYMAIV